MTQYTELTAAPVAGPGPGADMLRAAAAYLARYKGTTRIHARTIPTCGSIFGW